MSAFPGTQGPKHVFRTYWAKPWLAKAEASGQFRGFCWRHGFVSPHFTRREAACHDGTQVPESLRKECQHHAFNLEKLRHRLGDIPIAVDSWYRTPGYNRDVGGVRNSQHLKANATDTFSNHLRPSRDRFLAEAEVVFKNDAIGTERSGTMHLDSRGTRVRFIDF